MIREREDRPVLRVAGGSGGARLLTQLWSLQLLPSLYCSFALSILAAETCVDVDSSRNQSADNTSKQPGTAFASDSACHQRLWI